MDINLELFKYFYMAAKHKSISKTATALFTSQPNVSKNIKKLEEHLGKKLFLRTPSGLILTADGKALYKNVSVALKTLSSAIKQTPQNESLQVLNVSISQIILNNVFHPYIKTLKNRFSEINFTTFLKNEESLTLLKEGKLDLAVLKINDALNPNLFNFKKLATLNYVFAYNPHYFNFENNITLEQLKKHTIISKSIETQTGSKQALSLLNTFSKTINCTNDSNILKLVEEGLGVGIAPKEYISDKLKHFSLPQIKLNQAEIFVVELKENNILKDLVK